MPEAKTTPTGFWENVLGRLPPLVQRRLAAPVRVEIDGSNIRIVAPNQFALNLISENSHLLQKAFAELGMMNIRIQLVIDPELEIAGSNTPEAVSEPQVNIFAPPQGPSEQNYLIKPDPEWTFNTFRHGQYNHVAYLTCQRFANWDPKCHPTIIVAPSGSGKSHLAHAIWQEAMRNRPTARVVYVHAKAFMEHYRRIARAEGSRGEADRKKFSRKYHDADMFIMDDMHLLDANDWTKSRQEFRFILEDLRERGALILLISVRPVDSFTKCEEELKSRLRALGAIKMDPPDYQARIAILKRHAEKMGVVFPEQDGDKLAEMILERLSYGIRDLEGAISALDDHIKSMEKPALDEAVIIACFGEHRTNPRLNITIIQDKVANYFNITVRDLKLNRRECPLPWTMAVYLCRDMLHADIQDIAMTFEVDAPTVSAALRSIGRHEGNFFRDARTIREELVST